MGLTVIISRIFSVIYLLILYYFILRVLRLIKEDRDQPAAAGGLVIPQWGLEVMEAGITGLRPGTLIPLSHGLTMGRNEDNGVVLEDPFISFHHLQFFIHDGRYVIEDLASTNGTLLNQAPLEQKTYLRVDDTITLGSTVFRVRG